MIAVVFWLSVGIIIYTYAGYPLILTVLARMRPAVQRFPTFHPTVTLLISAYNEELVIADKLENSLAFDYPHDRLQVLVAADGSNDRTLDIVREYADRGIEISYLPARQGKMAAIKHAMSLARGEIVVFSDANNSYDTNTLRELVAPFADPTIGVSTGAKSIVRGDGVLGESEGLYWKYEGFIKQQETRLGCCTSVAGEILAIRRDLFDSPPDHIINDDFYIAMRAVRRGFRIVYVPEARSFERISLSAHDEIARRSRIIVGRYQAIALAPKLLPMRRPLFVWQVVSHKFLRPLVPIAMVTAFLANLIAIVWPVYSTSGNLILCLSSPVNWVMFIFQLIFYGTAWGGNHLTDAKGIAKLLYIPSFLFNSNLAALIGLYRYISRSQTQVWKRIQRREGTGNARAD